jgi:hypothetical protein
VDKICPRDVREGDEGLIRKAYEKYSMVEYYFERRKEATSSVCPV